MLREGRSWSGRERNCAFLNTRDGRFANASATSGFDLPDDARALAVLDWDGDGDQDFWVTNRNEPRLRLFLSSSTGQGWVELRLEANGTSTNAQAVGARVELVTRGPAPNLHVRTVRAGEGYLSQSSPRVHLGLGAAREIERVTVRWPGGAREDFSGVSVGRAHLLRQGTGKAEPLSPRGTPSVLSPGLPSFPPPTSSARVPLVALYSAPRELEVRPFGGQPAARIPFGSGKPLLLNLFASWCVPCAEELAELTREASALRGAGLDVLALAVDGLGDDRGDPGKAAELLRRIGFPFPGGAATPGTLEALQRLNDAQFPLHKPLPVPSSFLFDPSGHLSVIYKGKISTRQVLADLGHSGLPRRERWVGSAPLGGTALESPVIERASIQVEAQQRFAFALGLEAAGMKEAAILHYRDLATLWPDFAEAHLNAGSLLLALEQLPAAETEYRAALRSRPGFAEAHFSLGALRERQGNLAGAETEYQEALRLKPRLPGLHNALGVLHAKGGRLEAARAAFQAELELSSTSAEVHNNLGRVLLGLGDTVQARATFEKALSLDANHADANNNLGVILKRQGDLDGAERHYAAAVAANPRFPEALNNLGLLLEARGKPVEARAQFQRALEVDPTFAPARRNLERLTSR